MGISMSDSLIAEGNRLGLKARALTSFAKKNASLNHKSETKNIYLTPRALSHSDKFQLQKLQMNARKKVVRIKHDDPQIKEVDKTPVFASEIEDNYLQSASAVERKQKEANPKRKIKRINKEENNYFVFATKQEKNMDSPANGKVNAAKGLQSPELKLPLNSVIQEKVPVRVGTFSEFRKVNKTKKTETNKDENIKAEPKGNRINELLIKLKNQKKQSNNLLEKYLPKSKSKTQQLQAYTYGLMMPKEDETIISSIRIQTVKSKKKQPEEQLYLPQKIYTSWKHRTDSLRKSKYIIQSRSSDKVNSVCDVYGIEKDKKPIGNNKLKQSAGLAEKKSIMYSEKPRQEKNKSKDSSNLHSSSWRSEGKLKLIHF